MDKIRKDIELLSKILNDKNILDNRNIVNVYNQLYSYFENDFCNVLQHTDLLHKDSILNSIEDILTGMELFLIYPEIIGKTIIGLQILDATLWKNCMEGVLSSKTIDYVLGNRNIPIFIMNGQDETVIAHNNTSNKVIFDKDDYLNFNRKWFNQYKIVIKKLLHTFILKDETIDKNLVFLYLPRYMDYTAFNRDIIEKVEAIFVYGNMLETNASSNYRTQFKPFIYKFSAAREIPLYSILNNGVETIVKNEDVDSFATHIDLLNNYKRACNNYMFTDKLKSTILQIDSFYKCKISELNSVQKQVNIDLVKAEQSGIKEILRKIFNKINNEVASLNNEYNNSKGVSNNLIKKTNNFENLLQENLNVTEPPVVSYLTLNTWKTLVLQYIALEKYDLAKEYISCLEKANNRYVYCLKMLSQKARGVRISKKDINMLSTEVNTEFIRHVKLELCEELNLTELQCAEIASGIKALRTPLEYFYLGKWLENKSLRSAVIKYKIALERGYLPAGEYLMQFLGKTENISLKWLASMMVPCANYQLGKKLLEEKRYAKGIMNLKIAATYKYLPAIQYLTDDLYKKITAQPWPLRNTGSNKEKIGVCTYLYEYILENENSSIEDLKLAKERIGFLYKYKGDYRRALDYWASAATATSLYECGCIYQYGKQDIQTAVKQDLQKAADFFLQAKQLGHLRADEEYAKVVSWIRANKALKIKKEQQTHTEYEPIIIKSSKPKKKSNGCFITTATCNALHKGDGCEELMTMRLFRDKMRQRYKIVDDLVNEYYRIAPRIVSKIDNEKNGKLRYDQLWKKYIINSVKLIKENKFYEASVVYINMVQELSRIYNEPLMPGIQEKAEQWLSQKDFECNT